MNRQMAKSEASTLSFLTFLIGYASQFWLEDYDFYEYKR